MKILDYKTFSNSYSIPTWDDANNIIPLFTKFKVVDHRTKKSWMMMRTSGKHHADVEPLTPTDTQVMNSVFGKDKSFETAMYRPVIIEINDSKYGAALMGFPHAGSNETDFKEITDKRSGGFDEGPNWDYVRDNGTTGHYCLHFRGSIRHTDEMHDDKAQSAINELQ